MSEAVPNLRAQISSMALAFMLLDPELKIAEANPAAEDMLSLSARRLIGTSLFEVLDLSQSNLDARLADGPVQIVARAITIGIGGRERRVNLRLSPVHGHAGYSVLTLSDAGHVDFDREDSGIKAPAILSHEIKNPLAAIKGAGQLLGRKLSPQDQPLAKLISDEVDRIARLIDRMQHLGRDMPAPLGAVNLHESIRKALANLRAGLVHPIAIAEEFDPSLPMVRANSDTLEQILLNILANARDALDGTLEPRITVRTRFVSGLKANIGRGGEAVELPVEISVYDNGPGFADGLEAHIFEPFVTSKKSGQGLGLALVKKLVRDSGGVISAKRDRMRGETHFRINLAICDAE